MKNSIISGLRQGLGPRFLLGVMAIVTVLVLSSVEPLIKLYREFSILANGYHIQFFMTALSSDTFTPFVTIVAVLPFAGNYVDEVKSKFSRFAMLRTSYSSYLFSRIFICFLLGGMVILLGVLVTYFLCTLLFLPMESATVEEANELPKLIGQCFLLFLSGGFWAVLGMTLSTMMESKYIAYASPSLSITFW